MNPVKKTATRSPWFLKIIILQLFIKGMMILPLSIWLFTVNPVNLEAQARQIMMFLNLDTDHDGIRYFLENTIATRSTLLLGIAFGLLLYATLCLVEAYGLHQRRRWAEYLTVGAISCFIPFEIYELFQGFSMFFFTVLALNIAIVHYLIRHKELFQKKSPPPTK